MTKKTQKPFLTKQELKQMVVSIGGGIVLLGVLGVLVWLIILWGTPVENKVKYDTSVLEICVNPEPNTDDEFTLNTNSKIAVGYVGSVRVHEWQVALPKDRTPDDEGDVDIVICVDENRKIFKTCKYTGGGITTEYIQQLNPLIYVFDQDSGASLGSVAFQGKMPRFSECPLSYNNSDHFSGGLPTDDFIDWVEANIP